MGATVKGRALARNLQCWNVWKLAATRVEGVSDV
jgi:hypothetical protein